MCFEVLLAELTHLRFLHENCDILITLWEKNCSLLGENRAYMNFLINVFFLAKFTTAEKFTQGQRSMMSQ